LAGGTCGRGDFCPGVLLSGGLLPGGTFVRGAYARSHQVQCVYEPSRLSVQHRSVTDKQTKNRQTRPRSSAGSRPPLPKFSEYVEVEAHYIFHPNTIWVRPLFTKLGPNKTQKADFATKQTNICRLSGDINQCHCLQQCMSKVTRTSSHTVRKDDRRYCRFCSPERHFSLPHF